MHLFILLRQDFNRQDVEKLLSMLYDKNPIKFKWIKSRIRNMWPDWLEAMKAFKNTRNTTSAVQKKVLPNRNLSICFGEVL